MAESFLCCGELVFFSSGATVSLFEGWERLALTDSWRPGMLAVATYLRRQVECGGDGCRSFGMDYEFLPDEMAGFTEAAALPAVVERTVADPRLIPDVNWSLELLAWWRGQLFRMAKALEVVVATLRKSALMIPPFDDHGYLPPGIHPASLDEIGNRFGCESKLRRVQMESLRWLVDLGRRAGVVRLVINGSFTTDVFEPNDVDCVLLIQAGFPRDEAAGAELIDGLPFLEMNLVGQVDFDMLVERFFATDRHSVAKGMVEII